MKKTLFWKSVFRRPLAAVLILLLLGAAALGMGEKFTEYGAVSAQVDTLNDYYRPIGTLISSNWDVRAGMDLVASSPYVDFLDTRRYASGVLDGIYNADIDGSSSDHEGSAASFGVNTSEILSWVTLLDKTYEEQEGSYLYTFRIADPLYGYPERAFQGMALQIWHEDAGEEAFAAEDATLTPGETYLIRCYYYDNVRDASPYHLCRADPNGKWFLTETEGEALLPILLADEDVALQEMNRHTMQVVSTADMRKMPNVQESSHSYYLEEGRWLDAEDQALANPVCVVHVGFAQLRGLSLGDEITLTLRDLPETYLGYVISDFQDSWDTYATQSVTLQIVGIYGTLSPNPVQMSYTSNYLYIPDSVMPDGFGVGDGSVYDSSFSFLLRSPADKDAFLTETRPALLDLGLDVQFIERDWETFAAASDALKDSALSGLLLYGALFLTVAAVCAFVYVHQRTKEIAIARALGMGAGETLWGSFVPYALLAAVGIGAGSYFARRIAWGQILPKLEEISPEPVVAPPWTHLALLGLCLLLVAALPVFLGLRHSARRSVLEVLQGVTVRPRVDGAPASAVTPKGSPASQAVPGIVIPQAQISKKHRGGGAALARFTLRHALRSPVRTALYLCTALLFGISLAVIQQNLSQASSQIDALYETVQVTAEVVKTNPTASVNDGSGENGFIAQETIDQLLNTGFFSDYYAEAQKSNAMLLLILPSQSGKVLQQEEDLTIFMPSDEAKFLSQEGNSIEIEYFPGYDGSIFSQENYGETNELGLPAHALPVILPRELYESWNPSGGSNFVLGCRDTIGNPTVRIAGVYDGTYVNAGAILMPAGVAQWIGVASLSYTKANFEVDRAKNRELPQLLAEADEIVSDPMAGSLPLSFLLWDEELREAIGPLNENVEVLELLYPLVLLLSALTAAGLTALLLVQRTKTAALLRVIGVSRIQARWMLGTELLLPALLGECIVVLALMNLFPMVSAGSMAEGAAIYLLGAIVGALLGVYMVTRKRPLELLQVKE